MPAGPRTTQSDIRKFLGSRRAKITPQQAAGVSIDYYVRPRHTGRKSFRHPAVGVLTLDVDAMELPAQPGLRHRPRHTRPRHSAALSPWPPPPGRPARSPIRRMSVPLLMTWA